MARRVRSLGRRMMDEMVNPRRQKMDWKKIWQHRLPPEANCLQAMIALATTYTYLSCGITQSVWIATKLTMTRNTPCSGVADGGGRAGSWR